MKYEKIEKIWVKFHRGDALTNSELNHLEPFIDDLVSKLEVLGSSWSLAADKAREHQRKIWSDQYWRKRIRP